MRKAVIALMIMIASAFPAFSAQYVDSFSIMNNNPLYLELIEAIKNAEGEQKVLDAYDAYISSGISCTERSRVEYHLARYYKDMKNKTEALKHIEMEKKYMDMIPSDAPEVEKLMASVDETSAEYFVTKDMKVGMRNSNLAKELYSKYPDEVIACLTEAFRLIYTPGIAGGSPRKALRILDDLEKNAGSAISKVDLYSLYVAKALALSKRDEFDLSDEYLDKALKFYTGDPTIQDTRKDNTNGRKEKEEY